MLPRPIGPRLAARRFGRYRRARRAARGEKRDSDARTIRSARRTSVERPTWDRSGCRAWIVCHECIAAFQLAGRAPSGRGRARIVRDRSSGIIVGDVAAISRLAELEREMIGSGTADHELSEVDCAVVKRADEREVPKLVTAAVALKLDVMQIEPDVPPASRHRAAVAISRQHLFPLADRDSRGDPLRRGDIERAEVDGIAGRALGHGRIDLDVPSTAVLPATFTIGALLDRDLVGR